MRNPKTRLLNALRSSARSVPVSYTHLSITKERKQKYDFSEAYYDSKVAFAVKKGGKTFDNIKDKKKAEKEALSSLKGKTVAAKVGTVGATYANENAEKYGYKVRQFKDCLLYTSLEKVIMGY